MESSKIAALENRLKSLETQNRRLRLAGIAAIVAVVSLFALIQCGWGGPDGLKTDRLILMDIQNRPRAVLSIEHDEPVLSFFDYRGGRRMEMGLFEGGWPKVSLYRGGDSEKRVELYVGPDRSEVVVEYEDTQGLLTVVHDGTKKVGFQYPDGAPIATMGTAADAPPEINLVDADGKLVFHAPGDKSSGKRRR